MAIRGSVTIVNGAEHTLSNLLEGNKRGVEAAILYWHRKFAPIHFTTRANKRYGYQPRKGDNEPPRIPNPKYSGNKLLGFRTTPTIANWRYSWRKRRVKRHNKPLVWSGLSERQILRSIQVRFRHIRKAGVIRGIGVMQAPSYFYKYHVKGVRDPVRDASGRITRNAAVFRHTQPDKYNELVRTTPDEQAKLLQIHNTAAAAYLASAPVRRSRRRVA